MLNLFKDMYGETIKVAIITIMISIILTLFSIFASLTFITLQAHYNNYQGLVDVGFIFIMVALAFLYMLYTLFNLTNINRKLAIISYGKKNFFIATQIHILIAGIINNIIYLLCAYYTMAMFNDSFYLTSLLAIALTIFGLTTLVLNFIIYFKDRLYNTKNKYTNKSMTTASIIRLIMKSLLVLLFTSLPIMIMTSSSYSNYMSYKVLITPTINPGISGSIFTIVLATLLVIDYYDYYKKEVMI